MRRLKDKAVNIRESYSPYYRTSSGHWHLNRRIYLYKRLVPPPAYILRESIQENL